MDRFRVALSGDFRRPDGSPAYPMFDLGPLTSDPTVEIVHVDPVDGHMPADRLAGIDALILLVPRFDARSIPADGRLALVARFGVGYDSVDVDACTAAGIGVAITPDGVRRPVAVAIVTYMLALAGRMMAKDRIVRAGPAAWPQRNDHMGLGLTTRTFGQLGVGNIGLEALKLLQPFGMRLIAHDPYVDPAAARAMGVEMVDLDRLFREADFLSVSVPLNAETRGIVDAARLRAMKPTAFLINTARGPVVDQRALTRALTEGWIAGAGIDVFEVEPCPVDEALLGLDNVILSPHSLCWTDECFAGIGAADVRAVQAVKAGRAPTGLVDRRVLDNPIWQQRLTALGRRFG